MNDSAVPVSRIITVLMWTLTALAFKSAVALTIMDMPQAGNLVAHGACCVAAMATVSHIRCIALKSVRSLRATVLAAEHDRPPGIRGV